MVMLLIVSLVERSIGMNIIDFIKSIKSTLKCEICGENRPWCLDFHHINPEEKEGEIAKLIESPRRLQEELKKCIVLCANCHRDLHYKERNAGVV